MATLTCAQLALYTRSPVGIYPVTKAVLDARPDTVAEESEGIMVGGLRISGLAGVLPGQNSFQRYIRLQLNVLPAVELTNIYFYLSGELHRGVRIVYALTDQYRDPTTAPMEGDVLTSTPVLWCEGLSRIGQATNWLVLQLQAELGCVGGNSGATLQYRYWEW